MNKYYCTACSDTCLMTIMGSGAALVVEGNKCPEGRELAIEQLHNPPKMLATTVRTNFPDVPVISVRTADPIPKDSISKAIDEINQIVVTTELACGDVLIENVAKTGVSVIVTSPALMQLGAEFENNNDRLSSYDTSSRDESVSKESGGGRNVRLADTDDVVDEADEDGVGGFVGAAGEAVGVDDPTDEAESKELRERHQRPHIGG